MSYFLGDFEAQRVRSTNERKIIGLSMDIIKGINYNHQMTTLNAARMAMRYIPIGQSLRFQKIIHILLVCVQKDVPKIATP